MGYSVRVIPEHRLAIVRLVGDIRGPELQRSLRDLVGDPAWAPGFYVAWDARALRVLDLLPADLSAYSADAVAFAERLGGGRSAVLARNLDDAMTVKLLSLRQRGRRELRAFLRWEEAAAWLGVPEHVLGVGSLWRPWVPVGQEETPGARGSGPL